MKMTRPFWFLPLVLLFMTKNLEAGFFSARSSSQYGLEWTTDYGALTAIDGKISEEHSKFFHSEIESNPWLELSMPDGYISGVEIVTRYGCCEERVRDIEVRAGLDPVPNGFKGILTINSKVATFVGPADDNLKTYRINFDRSVRAKYVTLQRIGGGVTLEINEVTMIKSQQGCQCGLAMRSTRIVGGEETEVNEYPWQVGLVNAGTSRVGCGGSLISNRWILTAAHCTVGKTASSIQALLGEHDYEDTTETTSVRMGISKIENHPDYNRQTLNYDFSLLKMEEMISFDNHPHIRPICLPVDATNDYHGFVATVTGWGDLVSNQPQPGGTNKLREVDVKVLKNNECKNDYGYPSDFITDQMLCANVEGGGKDSCQGDSGGPLVTAGTGDGMTVGGNYELIGVVSWGYGCAEAEHPGVYARVTKQLDWIYDTTQQGWSTCPRE